MYQNSMKQHQENSQSVVTFSVYDENLKQSESQKIIRCSTKKLIENPHQAEIVDMLFKRDKMTFQEYSVLKQKLLSNKYFAFLHNQMIENESMFAELVKSLNYQFIPAGNLIFQKGDIAEKVYIILEGSVVILLKTMLGDFQNNIESYNIFNVEQKSSQKINNKYQPEKQQSQIEQNDYINVIPRYWRNQTMVKATEQFLQIKITVPQEREIAVPVERIQVRMKSSFYFKSCRNIDIDDSIESEGNSVNEQENKNFESSNKRNENEKSQANSQTLNILQYQLQEYFIEQDMFQNILEFPQQLQGKQFKHYTLDLNATENLQQNFPGFAPVADVATGELIGELQTTKTNLRNNTMITNTDSHFLVLDQRSYFQYLFRFQGLILEQQLNFLKSFDIFQQIVQKLPNLFYCFQHKKFHKGDILYQQGDPVQYFYLVQEGLINISRQYKQTEIKQELIQQGQYPEDEGFSSRELLFDSDNMIFRSKNQFSFGFEKNSQVQKHIADISSNNYFGEQQIVIKQNQRSYTARVVSAAAEVYMISLKNLQIICKHNDIFERLENNLQIQAQWRQQYLLEESIIEFLKDQKFKTQEKANNTASSPVRQEEILFKQNQNEIKQVEAIKDESVHYDYLQMSDLEIGQTLEKHKKGNFSPKSKTGLQFYKNPLSPSAQSQIKTPSQETQISRTHNLKATAILSGNNQQNQSELQVSRITPRRQISFLNPSLSINLDIPEYGEPRRQQSVNFCKIPKEFLNQTVNVSELLQDSQDFRPQTSETWKQTPQNKQILSPRSPVVRDYEPQAISSIQALSSPLFISGPSFVEKETPIARGQLNKKTLDQYQSCSYVRSHRDQSENLRKEKLKQNSNRQPGFLTTGAYQCLVLDTNNQEIEPADQRPQTASSLTSRLVALDLFNAKRIKVTNAISSRSNTRTDKEKQHKVGDLQSYHFQKKENSQTIDKQEKELKPSKKDLSESIAQKEADGIGPGGMYKEEFNMDFKKNRISKLYSLKDKVEVQAQKKKMISDLIHKKRQKQQDDSQIDPQLKIYQENEFLETERQQNADLFKQNLIINLADNIQTKFDWANVQNTLLKTLKNQSNLCKKRRADVMEKYQFNQALQHNNFFPKNKVYDFRSDEELSTRTKIETNYIDSSRKSRSTNKTNTNNSVQDMLPLSSSKLQSESMQPEHHLINIVDENTIDQIKDSDIVEKEKYFLNLQKRVIQNAMLNSSYNFEKSQIPESVREQVVGMYDRIKRSRSQSFSNTKRVNFKTLNLNLPQNSSTYKSVAKNPNEFSINFQDTHNIIHSKKNYGKMKPKGIKSYQIANQ